MEESLKLAGINWGIRRWLLMLSYIPAVTLVTWPMTRMSADSLAVFFRYGSNHPVRWRKRIPMDVPTEIAKWHEALVGLFLSHTKEEMDNWDYKLDDLMTVVLNAPVAQLREFAKGLLEAMKGDERVPYFLWAPFHRLGEKILGSPDEAVIHLKAEMAERIARMVEKDVQPQLSQAIVDALKWRDEDVLQKVDIAVREGKPARLKGRESCLFLEVGEGDDCVRVML